VHEFTPDIGSVRRETIGCSPAAEHRLNAERRKHAVRDVDGARVLRIAYAGDGKAAVCPRVAVAGFAGSREETPIAMPPKRLLIVRGQRVILDTTLADLYGVTTRRLNEQVRRNQKRFPSDFLLELTVEEFANLKSHFATSSWGGRRKPPFAFTEHGAIMAATILNSSRAVQMSVYVVRAFVRLRDFLASNRDLARKLRDLEALGRSPNLR
jgi:hypothetical protein